LILKRKVYLGVAKFRNKEADKKPQIGSITGLAWTSVGGDILHVDVTVMNGAGKLTLTGQLGDVMKESAQAALSYIRTNAKKLKLNPEFFKKHEIHIHLPEGGIPKDGPSAGITMTMAMISAIGNRPARADVAMTGEITLRGEVLPIGGLNEKLLAAKRAGIKTVLIPKENLKDLSEIQVSVKEGLKIVPIAMIDEALPSYLKQNNWYIGYYELSVTAKWRPMVFDDESDRRTSQTRSECACAQLAHAFIFSGTRGCDKTTTARILARAIYVLLQRIFEPCNGRNYRRPLA
jgi:ATP-dependent Lon protease